jgi:transposase-like protein
VSLGNLNRHGIQKVCLRFWTRDFARHRELKPVAVTLAKSDEVAALKAELVKVREQE